MANNCSRPRASDCRISSSVFLNCFAVSAFVLWIASFRRVSMRLHAIVEIENLSGVAKRRVALFFRPNIERAFSMFRFAMLKKAVGVFGRKKSAFAGCHVASDVIENVARDPFVLSILSDLKPVEISDGELRLIVKHLFEM